MNKKQIFISIVVIVIILGGIWKYNTRDTKQNTGTQNATSTEMIVPDIKNLTYNIDGTSITLKDGIYEENITDSASAEITEILSSSNGDMNKDSLPDTAVVLVQSGAGTGTFYSLSVAYSAPSETKTTEATLLGDRIDGVKISINKSGILTVSYLDRKNDEPMSAEPTVLIKKEFILKNGSLIEI
ncbi:MAG: hypothetical protein WCW14_00115 [Candidatus Paceibacterota bacterium]|jgi:hypothetical protein